MERPSASDLRGTPNMPSWAKEMIIIMEDYEKRIEKLEEKY